MRVYTKDGTFYRHILKNLPATGPIEEVKDDDFVPETMVPGTSDNIKLWTPPPSDSPLKPREFSRNLSAALIGETSAGRISRSLERTPSFSGINLQLFPRTLEASRLRGDQGIRGGGMSVIRWRACGRERALGFLNRLRLLRELRAFPTSGIARRLLRPFFLSTTISPFSIGIMFIRQQTSVSLGIILYAVVEWPLLGISTTHLHWHRRMRIASLYFNVTILETIEHIHLSCETQCGEWFWLSLDLYL